MVKSMNKVIVTCRLIHKKLVRLLKKQTPHTLLVFQGWHQTVTKVSAEIDKFHSVIRSHSQQINKTTVSNIQSF